MTTTIEPPADAVARDPHWAAKMARLRDRQQPQAVLRICDDQALKDALAQAEYTERRIRAAAEDKPDDPTGKAGIRQAAAAVTKAQKAIDDATITLTFRGLPRPEYEALVKAHPPTEEQATDGEPWNVETFAPALISAASVDGMPEDDAAYFLTNWAAAEASALFNAAMSVQQEDRTDLGKG